MSVRLLTPFCVLFILLCCTVNSRLTIPTPIWLLTGAKCRFFFFPSQIDSMYSWVNTKIGKLLLLLNICTTYFIPSLSCVLLRIAISPIISTSPNMIIFVTFPALYTHWTPNHSLIHAALRLGSLVSGILSSKSHSSQMSDSRQTPTSSIQSKSLHSAYPGIPVRWCSLNPMLPMFRPYPFLIPLGVCSSLWCKKTALH